MMYHDPNHLGSLTLIQIIPKESTLSLSYYTVVCIFLLCPHCCLIIDEDEEGDRITVRGDEELQAMINGVGHSCVQYWIVSNTRS